MKMLCKSFLAAFLFLPGLASAQSSITNLTGWLVYSRAGSPAGTVWATDLSFQDVLLADTAQYPKVSDNGRYLFYMHQNGDPNVFHSGSVVRVRMQDSDHMTLFNPTDFAVGYDMVNADSSSILNHSCDNYRQSYGGGDGIPLGTGDCYDDAPDLRTSDAQMAFHNVPMGMYLFDIHVGASSKALIPNTQPGDCWPTWSQDGQWLLFGRTNTALYPLDTRVLNIVNYYKIRPDGTGLTKLTSFADTDSAHFAPGGAWSANGQAVYVARKNADHTYTFVAVKTDGSGLMNDLPTVPGNDISFVSGSPGNHIFTAVAPKLASMPLQAYPNPFSREILIDLPAGRYTVAVFDLSNKKILEMPDQAGRVALSGQELPKGLYFITASNSKETLRAKRMKE